MAVECTLYLARPPTTSLAAGVLITGASYTCARTIDSSGGVFAAQIVLSKPYNFLSLGALMGAGSSTDLFG